MSKGNMLLGQARGKVGSLVFSRVNGQQVTRSRAEQVKNPKTEAQMIQRILLNTVIQAYSRMSEITDHSFENVPTGQPCMSQFMRRNLNLMRNYLSREVASGLGFDEIYAFAAPGTNQFTMNPWIIATGSLPAVTIQSISAASGAIIAISGAGSVPTYQEVIDSLGIQRGDQLTFIGQEAWTDGRASFKFCRVILDPRNADGTEASLDIPLLDASQKINYPSPRNENTDDFVFSSTSTSLVFSLPGGTMFGGSVIVSRQRTDGTWLRSNAQIVLDTVPYTLIQNLSMQEALDMAYSGVLELGSERYLNNASRASRLAGIASNSVDFVVNEVGDAVGVDGNKRTQLIGITTTTYNGITVVVGYNAQGQQYLIYGNSSYANPYGKILKSSTGNTSTAWADALIKTGSDPTVVGGTLPIVWAYGLEDTDQMINDQDMRLAELGVDLGVFCNS